MDRRPLIGPLAGAGGLPPPGRTRIDFDHLICPLRSRARARDRSRRSLSAGRSRRRRAASAWGSTRRSLGQGTDRDSPGRAGTRQYDAMCSKILQWSARDGPKAGTASAPRRNSASRFEMTVKFEQSGKKANLSNSAMAAIPRSGAPSPRG